VLARPNIARALWIDALVDASIYREWVTNVGRRAAPARIAHVLCEVALRMQAAGVSAEGGFELPLTQEQLAAPMPDVAPGDQAADLTVAAGVRIQ
jgi:CRP-like cAMP-binding protein